MFTFSPNLAHGFLIPIISGIPDSETWNSKRQNF